MLVQIELVAPVAVCYQTTTPAHTTPRAIFCDLQKNIAPEKLGDLFTEQTNNPPRQPFVWLDSESERRWQQHPRYPELIIGPRTYPNDDALVFCQIQQEHLVLSMEELQRYHAEKLPAPWVSFFFTTTGDENDVWRVWTLNEEMKSLAISSWGRSSFGGSVINPNLPDGGLVAERTGWLQPTPDEPYLPCYATGTEALERWQDQPLPFRVRQSE